MPKAIIPANATLEVQGLVAAGEGDGILLAALGPQQVAVAVPVLSKNSSGSQDAHSVPVK